MINSNLIYGIRDKNDIELANVLQRAHVAIVVYDITDLSSFNSAKVWIEEIKRTDEYLYYYYWVIKKI